MHLLCLIFLTSSLLSCKNSFLSLRKGSRGERTAPNDGAGEGGKAGPTSGAENAVPTVAESEFIIETLPATEQVPEGIISKRPEGGVEVGGSVSGTWDKALSPVYVTSNLTVGPDKTLAIGEGVTVIFQGKYRISVEGGQLKIVGTANNKVQFTAENKAEGWGGIRLCPDADCQSDEARGKLEVRYANFEYARKDNMDPNDNTWRRGGVFYIRGIATVVIENSNFKSNNAQERGGAIEVIADNRNVLFRRNLFEDNSNDGGAGGGGGALHITHGRSLTLEGNIFTSNKSKGDGGAIYLLDSSAIYLKDNAFRNNVAVAGGAIRCDGHAALISIDASNAMTENVPNDLTCDP